MLYCNTGNRSGKALDLLKQKGFSMLMNAPGVKQYDYELYKVGSINAEGFLKIANDPNVLIIDARQKQDYDAGHMKGAINIPYGEPLETGEQGPAGRLRPGTYPHGAGRAGRRRLPVRRALRRELGTLPGGPGPGAAQNRRQIGRAHV